MKKSILIGLLLVFSQATLAQTQSTPPPQSPWDQCIKFHVTPKAWGEENPPNRAWPRPLMGSHQPSPMEKEKAEQECRKLGFKPPEVAKSSSV